MNKETTASGGTRLGNALQRCPLVAILRGLTPEEAAAMGEALVAAGFAVLEVPLNSPRPFDSIKVLAAGHPDCLVGAGTVMTVEEVDRVAASGGQMVVQLVKMKLIATVFPSIRSL